jgi:hypothetical protein
MVQNIAVHHVSMPKIWLLTLLFIATGVSQTNGQLPNFPSFKENGWIRKPSQRVVGDSLESPR